MRTELFICHATPNDNAFAAWLATKLELHGYSVWIDIHELDPASDFWQVIETTIREKAAKFLFVATRESVGGKRDGVMKELAVADRVRRSIGDFIVPLRVDDISYDDFPVELVRQNAIDFRDNWEPGLLVLLEYLEKQNVPRSTIASDMSHAVSRWKEIRTSEKAAPMVKKDYYYSNLFYTTLPESLYVYQAEAEEVLKNKHFPYRKAGEYVVSFACPLCAGTDPVQKAPVESLIADSEGLVVNDFEVKDANRICVDLLNWSTSNFFYNAGLRKFKSENLRRSRNRYFFPLGVRSRRYVTSRQKFLSGDYTGRHWHYGLSAYYTDYPCRGFIFGWHLIFTDSNGALLSDSQQITARRSKGRLFFNKEWRDLLQAAVFHLSHGTDAIDVALCCDDNCIHIERKPLTLTSSIGYVEPDSDPAEIIKESDNEA